MCAGSSVRSFRLYERVWVAMALFFEIDREGVGICLNNNLSANGPWRDRVIIGIKPDGEIGIDLCRSRIPAIGQEWWQESHGFWFKAVYGSLARCTVYSDVGHMVPPLTGLMLKVFEVVKGPEGEKIIPDVMDGALFHLTFFVWASDIAGPWDDGKRAKELQE